MTTIVFLCLIIEVKYGKYGKSGECEEYNKYNEEFKHGEFQFGLVWINWFWLFIYQMPVLPTQMTVTTCCNVFCHIVNMCLY